MTTGIDYALDVTVNIQRGQLDLAMLQKAKRMLDAAPIPDGVATDTARALAEFQKIDRLIDLQIIAEMHWHSRFSNPADNPFR